MHVAAPPAVDALTHGVEAYVSAIGSPLTDAVALSAVRLQFGALRASINLRRTGPRQNNRFKTSGSKAFFFEKKKQKLLSISINIECQPRCLGNESFLVLFFKKELLSAALHQLFGLRP